MPVIGKVQEVGDKKLDDQHHPADLKVSRAVWGNVERSFANQRLADPLIIDVEGIEAGATLLFVNTDDPKIKAKAKELPSWSGLGDAVKEYKIPAKDIGGKQTLEFTDKAAMQLGLNPGCEFMIRQRDPAGNESERPTEVELSQQTVQNFKMQSGRAVVGDANIDTNSSYSYRDNRGVNRTSNEYRLVAQPDVNGPVAYASDIKLAWDSKTNTVTFSGEKALTGKTEIFLKALNSQKTYSVKADSDGNFVLPDVDLKPGDPYSIWAKDRNGVMETVVKFDNFDPKKGSPGQQAQTEQVQG